MAGSFLEPRHYRSEPGHYARNLVYDASNPGPIHVTGVPAERLPAVSLHLYGRTMNRFNIYDPAAGTRRAIDVAHNES